MSGANIKRLMDPEILAAIMDSATDGFTYTDETGYIVYNNRAYSEMTGLPDEKIQGHNIHQLVKEGFPISRMMLEVFQSRETRSELIKYQADSERLLLVTLSPVYSPDGRFRGAVGNVRDMTELMQLRQQMDITYLDYDREMQVKEKANRELVQRINEMLHLMEDYDIVGRSKAMHNLAELALRVSHVRSTVLITGESGVGKDVFCRMICRFAGSPDYIKISCGNLPENLLESELFGYEKGAFTGASSSGKIGKIELANHGTLFLDEIGELDMVCQVKLLRVLQDQTFEPLGDSKQKQVDTRVISATNKNLTGMVAQGAFREDLFYRINLITIRMPALRERIDDIPLLVEHFVEKQAELNNMDRVELSAEAFGYLKKLPYHGNIRELKNLIDRTTLISGKRIITDQDLKKQYIEVPVNQIPDNNSIQSLENVEKNMIQKAVELYGSNHSKIATALGLSRQTLYRRMEKYNIKLPE